jgi:hypothetical protein
MLAQEVFAVLSGGWKFRRQISDFGVVEGKASFAQEGECSSYSESGILEHVGGKSFVTEKEYQYFYNSNKKVIEVYFVQAELRAGLFCELDFFQGRAVARHECGRDVYEVTYWVKDESYFEIFYRVRGAKKKYMSMTNFLRVS